MAFHAVVAVGIVLLLTLALCLCGFYGDPIIAQKSIRQCQVSSASSLLLCLAVVTSSAVLLMLYKNGRVSRMWFLPNIIVELLVLWAPLHFSSGTHTMRLLLPLSPLFVLLVLIQIFQSLMALRR